MGYIYYEAKESRDEDFGKRQIAEKYVKDNRGSYYRESISARLNLDLIELAPEQENAILTEAEAYSIVARDEEYGDHDDRGKFNVSSSLATLSLSDAQAVLVQKGHFFGVIVEESALTVDGAIYGRCVYPRTPSRSDTSRTNYYRDLQYELTKK